MGHKYQHDLQVAWWTTVVLQEGPILKVKLCHGDSGQAAYLGVESVSAQASGCCTSFWWYYWTVVAFWSQSSFICHLHHVSTFPSLHITHTALFFYLSYQFNAYSFIIVEPATLSLEVEAALVSFSCPYHELVGRPPPVWFLLSDYPMFSDVKQMSLWRWCSYSCNC